MKDKNIFSLVELLFVIAVIAILIALLLPAVSKAYLISKRATCASNQKQFVYALYLYADDYGELLPATASIIKDCYKSYKLTPQIFICPGDSINKNNDIDNGFLNRDNSVSASYMFANHGRAPEDDFSMKTLSQSSIAIQWDLYGGSYDDVNCDKRNHGILGGNVTFLDGHCQWMKQLRWFTSNRPCDQ
jgi:prepilin-type processing-associated H-X9-DG protein